MKYLNADEFEATSSVQLSSQGPYLPPLDLPPVPFRNLEFADEELEDISRF